MDCLVGESLKVLNYMNGVAGSVLGTLCMLPVFGFFWAIWDLARSGSVIQSLQIFLSVFFLYAVFVAPITIVASTVIGVPVAYLLDKLGKYQGVWMTLAGALIGPFVFQLVWGSMGADPDVFSVVVGGCFGAISAAGFWWGSKDYPTRRQQLGQGNEQEI